MAEKYWCPFIAKYLKGVCVCVCVWGGGGGGSGAYNNNFKIFGNTHRFLLPYCSHNCFVGISLCSQCVCVCIRPYVVGSV